MISRRPERNDEGMVDDDLRIDILCERIGWFEIWTFELKQVIALVFLALVPSVDLVLELMLDTV